MSFSVSDPTANEAPQHARTSTRNGRELWVVTIGSEGGLVEITLVMKAGLACYRWNAIRACAVLQQFYFELGSEVMPAPAFFRSNCPCGFSLRNPSRLDTFRSVIGVT